ncbi:MAG TPA: carbamoyltransferase HypF [Clostridia bacterium]|nr:carbamoyltransferase HypF [Clostridia bacterium]
MELERYRIEVNGIVQGVGFRPFVYKLAKSLELKGEVRNTSSGVLIDVEGTPGSLDSFMDRLPKEAPSLAYIETIKAGKLEILGYDDFYIRESSPAEHPNTLISPDISTCPDCRRELFETNNRRYLYPFINCTNCGPRYTIISDIPYDRPNTTMGSFDMCGECGAQYGDPLDRRYHAQPVCCKACGPGMLLLDRDGKVVESYSDTPSVGGIDPSFHIIRKAAELLASGKILAVKGLGGYHLVCDASNENTVVELRRRKHRDEKPFALMARDIGTVRKYCKTDETSERFLQSPSAPIVLLGRKPGNRLPSQLAPGNAELGMMLPYTPIHLLLFFEADGKPSVCPELLVMTSGNKSDEPICFEDAEAVSRLCGIADYFLSNDRPIRTRTDDSVVRVFENNIYFIRRSRGYAPSPIITRSADLAPEQPSILALGAELKNTFCLTRGNSFFVSQHIGDLENMETLLSFEEGIAHYKRLFGISPKAVAYDMHPAYLTTGFVSTLPGDMTRIPVQHHQAHVASCMADNDLSGEAIGVSFDGTGYGGGRGGLGR